MSNRVLRDWTDSEVMDSLSERAEVFFTRLIMKADDFGYYHANIKLLKAHLYPLKTKMNEKEIVPLLSECERAGLIHTYTVSGKAYLQIINFGQRLRKMRSSFPPPQTVENEGEITPAAIGGQLAAVGGEPLLETETETERKQKDSEALTPPLSPPISGLKSTLESRKEKFFNDLVPFVGTYSKEMVRAFFNYWSEKNKPETKMKYELEKTFEIKLRLATWASRETTFNKNEKPKEEHVTRKRESENS